MCPCFCALFIKDLAKQDCFDVLTDNPDARSGVYIVHHKGKRHRVSCDMDTDNGGWTVRMCPT